jgi:cellulose synthase/poly-beta-1,6-N-acetylglucosamine synthase-like glycosyltransferase
MSLESVIAVLGVVSIAYFAALNLLYLVFTGIAWRSVARQLRRRSYDAVEDIFASPLSPGISVLLPAFDEESGVVESVRSLLRLRYPAHEVIVVNDGSTDGTLDRLTAAFDLVPVRHHLRDALPTAAVLATYASRRHPDLLVIDKANGGKADALNAGINAAQHPYICAVDADALIEEEALLRVAQPIIDDPTVVATGGMVRIVNGCEVDHGSVSAIRLPKSRLATLQVVEYFRAFLVGRMAWSEIGALLIISGAFGVFQRSAVEAAGGYWTDTVGEDAELVIRLHRHLREREEPYKIEFVPEPVCWTECPEDLGTLGRQRRRWQRGLAQALWRHRRIIGNPRYGAFGMVAMPYFLVFELIGPLLEVLAYLVLPLSVASGVLSPSYLIVFFIVAVLLGIVLSVSALALEEFSFRRHPSHREVARLIAYAVVDNFGYRQLNDLWRAFGLVDLVRRTSGWGVQRRRGFTPASD